MELTIREAATLTGRSPRTLRAQLARRELPGVKRGGQWWIDRRHLPLTEAQRRELQGKAERVRRLVDDVLPSRMAATAAAERQRSLADLGVFLRVLELRDLIASASDQAAFRGPLRRLRLALLDLGEAFHQFDPTIKLAAVNRARGHLSKTVAQLLADHGVPPADPAFTWVVHLEQEVLPMVAGLARWIDRLDRKP